MVTKANLKITTWYMQFINAYFALLREAYNDVIEIIESDTSLGFIIGLLILTPIFGTLFFFAVLVNAQEIADSPASTVISLVDAGSGQLAVTIEDNRTPLNSAEIEIFFDPLNIHLTNLSITPNLCEERFIITKVIDNVTGRLFYQCGTITPFSGTSTTLATINYTSQIPGTTTISFGPQSNVLAHDGFGTNVTKDRVGLITVN